MGAKQYPQRRQRKQPLWTATTWNHKQLKKERAAARAAKVVAIDEYKELNPFVGYAVSSPFVPTPAPAPIFNLDYDWLFDSGGLIDIFSKMLISEDCKQETFAEDSPDFA
jgi:hypothetical protein